MHAVVMQAYVEGVSTRRVDDLVIAMGGTGISRSEVSRICARLDTDVALWRTRSLDHLAFPYVFLDATFCKVRSNPRVVSQAVVIATGVSADGRREVLGCATGDSETEAFWTEFLRDLRERGLGGVQLVISDAHRGLVKPSALSSKAAAGSAAGSTSCATCWPRSAKATTRWCGRPPPAPQPSSGHRPRASSSRHHRRSRLGATTRDPAAQVRDNVRS